VHYREKPEISSIMGAVKAVEEKQSR